MKSAYYVSINGGRTGSRSRRAQIAETEGKEPATRAAKTWGFKSAAALKNWVSPCEWHHVSKYANVVDYFDVAAWMEDVTDFSEIAGLAKDLIKAGREMVLSPLVARIVERNLDASPRFRFRFTKENLTNHILSLYPALADLGAGAQADAIIAGGDLKTVCENAIQSRRETKLRLKAQALKAKIKAQMTPVILKAPKAAARLNELQQICGHFNANAIKRSMKARKAPFTPTEWRKTAATLAGKVVAA